MQARNRPPGEPRRRRVACSPGVAAVALLACALVGCASGTLPERVQAATSGTCPYAVVVFYDGPPLAVGGRVLVTSYADGSPDYPSDTAAPRITADQATADAASSAKGTAVAAFHTTLGNTGSGGMGDSKPGAQSFVGPDDPVWVVTVKLPNPPGCLSHR